MNLIDNTQIEVKIKAGKYLVPIKLKKVGPKVFARFSFNRPLIEEIKAFQGARWDPDGKQWYFNDNQRNRFQLRYLCGEDVYRHYDTPIDNFLENLGYSTNRPLRNHQRETVAFILARKNCIIAEEMGLGKTLSVIEAMEWSSCKDWWYIAPKSVIYAVKREFVKWQSKVTPRFFTYEGLTKLVKTNVLGKTGFDIPQGVVFDESSRLKEPTTQRSQAAMILSSLVRETFSDNSFVILMSGSPAPKSPADWWHQCEVACPGYLKEGDINKFKRRLGLIVERESMSGGVYPHLICWKDNPNRCNFCGEMKDHISHSPEDAMAVGVVPHAFIESKNEVAYLYERMKGLTIVKFKKDCLDLPDKQYKTIKLKPSPSVLRAAKLIVTKSARAIEALTLLRELSDGFQYKEIASGSGVCPGCLGKGKIKELGNDSEINCPNCDGKGMVDNYSRVAEQLPCPKQDALVNLLDEYEDCGRVVIYAGFTGSVDRCVEICRLNGWATIRVDGRGWAANDGNGLPISEDPLSVFQAPKEHKELFESYPKVAFIGQPGAAGMGLTLTASPVVIYYSNDFNAENRIQSEDRIHRMGMDENRGATIIDLIHLSTDEKVLENLKKKRDLQAMSLGDLEIKEESDEAYDQIQEEGKD